MDIIKKKWSEISTQPISEEAIQAKYLPADKYRFYPNSYESGVSFPTTTGHPVVLYILAGRCKYRFGDREVTLGASELAHIEKGSYIFEVVGDEGVRLIRVYEMPQPE